jgi:hypothetical protein
MASKVVANIITNPTVYLKLAITIKYLFDGCIFAVAGLWLITIVGKASVKDQ